MKTQVASILIFVFLIAGCESEIDKCAKAVQRDYLYQSEGSARLKCLNAASGKE